MHGAISPAGMGSSVDVLSPHLAAFLMPEVWDQATVEVLVPKEETHPQRHSKDSMELEAKAATWLFQAPHISE